MHTDAVRLFVRAYISCSWLTTVLCCIHIDNDLLCLGIYQVQSHAVAILSVNFVMAEKQAWEHSLSSIVAIITVRFLTTSHSYLDLFRHDE